LTGACLRRINIQHRLVCQVLEKQKAVKIIRLWTHYE
ncbi:MAG TPA: type II toxin-antitoxin system mRNA interferase toxin, RelE/StbE family, partial [Candidatus Aminicenantes bacterium]|nr:type II toxin-antitoxin system mRNA interferase toxin, RelE/StbE family [Candidatus Aminicenantes bacterium]